MYRETPHDWGIRYSYTYARLLQDPESLGLSKDIANVVRINDSFFSDIPDYEDEEAEQEEENYPCEKAEVRVFYQKGVQRNVIIPIEAIDVEEALPYGLVNLSKSFVFITCFRSPTGGPAKYKFLPHRDIVTVIDPFVFERQLLNLKEIPPTVENAALLDAWNMNEYTPPLEALEGVLSGEYMGRVFTRNLGIGLSGYGEDPAFLYHNSFKVARINPKGVILLDKRVHRLYEELSELGFQVERT